MGSLSAVGDIGDLHMCESVRIVSMSASFKKQSLPDLDWIAFWGDSIRGVTTQCS